MRIQISAQVWFRCIREGHQHVSVVLVPFDYGRWRV